LKPLEVLSIIATVRLSQIPCQLTAKMTCGLKSPTLADSELITVRMPKFESVDWHKVKAAFKFHQILRVLTVNIIREHIFAS